MTGHDICFLLTEVFITEKYAIGWMLPAKLQKKLQSLFAVSNWVEFCRNTIFKKKHVFLWFAVFVWIALFLLCKESKEYFNRSPWCKATWFDWPIQQLVGFHVFRDFGRPHRRCWTDRDTEQGRWSAHCQKVNILVEIICSLQISCFKLVIHQQLLAHGVNTLIFNCF